MLCQLKHGCNVYVSDHNVFYNDQHDGGEVATSPFPPVLRTMYGKCELSGLDHMGLH